jgi:Cof subfamily protein (haloacid dehalogenase superfamily)
MRHSRTLGIGAGSEVRHVMASQDVRLVIADVDGTLLTPDKLLTVRARAAVNALAQAGIGFTITSGRPPRGMKMLIDDLDLQGPITAFNGGLLLHPDLSVIQQRLIPAEAIPSVIDILTRHTLDVWSYTDADWRVPSRHGPHVDREEWTVKFAPSVAPMVVGAGDRPIKIVGVTDDREAMARAINDVRRACGTQVSAALSQPYYLDITHPSANKGEVVRLLSKLLDVPAAQIATIGDMPNDVLMFTCSGVSIAMGNASVDVQHAARFVTSSNIEEGFAVAMERFVLSTRSVA